MAGRLANWRPGLEGLAGDRNGRWRPFHSTLSFSNEKKSKNKICVQLPYGNKRKAITLSITRVTTSNWDITRRDVRAKSRLSQRLWEILLFKQIKCLTLVIGIAAASGVAAQEKLGRVEVSGERMKRVDPYALLSRVRDYPTPIINVAKSSPAKAPAAAAPAGPALVAKPPSPNDDICPRTGNPVDIVTGEKLLFGQDAAPQNASGLGVQRTYRSNSTLIGAFGKKWESALNGFRITAGTPIVCSGTPGQPNYVCIPSSAVLTAPDGGIHMYSKVSTNTYRASDSSWGG
ncbi:DUF6531 domain-containing protein, partial [Roseateles sp. DC23W]